jgi:hypothetical protein
MEVDVGVTEGSTKSQYNIIKLTWSERRKIKKIVEKFSLDWTIKKGKRNGI